MKKITAMLLALLMVLSMAACAKDDAQTDDSGKENETVTDTNTGNTSNDTTTDTEGEDVTAGDSAVLDPDADVLPEMGEGPAEGGMPTVDTTPELGADTTPDGLTPAQSLYATFEHMVTSDSSLTAFQIAEALSVDPIIPFMGVAMEVEPGFLSGFDADEITGFKAGAAFMPMIGSIPFTGYIFQLEEGADVDAFVKTLEDNANLRWNICVEADEMVTGSVDNYVFFCMSPISFK